MKHMGQAFFNHHEVRTPNDHMAYLSLEYLPIPWNEVAFEWRFFPFLIFCAVRHSFPLCEPCADANGWLPLASFPEFPRWTQMNLALPKWPRDERIGRPGLPNCFGGASAKHHGQFGNLQHEWTRLRLQDEPCCSPSTCPCVQSYSTHKEFWRSFPSANLPINQKQT